MSYEFVRPDSLPTVIFDGIPQLDPHPIVTAHGRPIPGPTYAETELHNLL